LTPIKTFEPKIFPTEQGVDDLATVFLLPFRDAWRTGRTFPLIDVIR
jgi:hypothetical protein